MVVFEEWVVVMGRNGNGSAVVIVVVVEASWPTNSPLQAITDQLG